MVLHEGKLLCVRLKPYKGSLREGAEAATDYWCLPGGGLEDGESLVAGVTREMVEETGVNPVVGNLLYIQQFMHGDKDYLEFFFHITNSQDYLDIDLSKSSHGLEEIAEIGFIDPAKLYVMPTFLSTEALQDHAATNGPPKIFSFL